MDVQEIIDRDLMGKIDRRKYTDYVKRLGQWHLCRVDRSDGRTLCGRPMLGNNYAADMTIQDLRPCDACFAEWEKQNG